MIRLNNTTYFVDNEGNKVDRYTSDCKLKMYNFAYETFVNYGGQIVAKVNGINESVNYPYYNRLVKAGYIVYKDTDLHHIEDKEEGLRVRRNIAINLNLAIQYIFNNEVEELKQNIYRVDDPNYINTVMYDTIDKMVLRNLNRKDNNLKFYPYDKDICKYGSMYLAIFAEPKVEKPNNSVYAFSSNFTKKLMSVLGNEYHFVNLPVKSQIIYTEEV